MFFFSSKSESGKWKFGKREKMGIRKKGIWDFRKTRGNRKLIINK